MTTYYFKFKHEWYFTEDTPTPKSRMIILLIDSEKNMWREANKYEYIRGWSSSELKDMFKPLDRDCVVT